MTSVEPGEDRRFDGLPDLRRAMGRFVTGVGVVTTQLDGEPHGMTVSSLSLVSLEPPAVLVSLTVGARTTEAVLAAGTFAISLLSSRQEAIARRFATAGGDHFANLVPVFGDHIVPVVPDALAHVECRLAEQLPFGDHVVVIGEVTKTCHRDGEALAFRRGRFGDFVDRGHAPMPWSF